MLLVGGFSRPCILELLHTHLASPSSALKTSMLRPAHISLVSHSNTRLTSRHSISARGKPTTKNNICEIAVKRVGIVSPRHRVLLLVCLWWYLGEANQVQGPFPESRAANQRMGTPTPVGLDRKLKEERMRTEWLLTAGSSEPMRVERGYPEKTHGLVASSGIIPTCENPGATPPGIEPDSPRLRRSGALAPVRREEGGEGGLVYPGNNYASADSLSVINERPWGRGGGQVSDSLVEGNREFWRTHALPRRGGYGGGARDYSAAARRSHATLACLSGIEHLLLIPTPQPLIPRQSSSPGPRQREKSCRGHADRSKLISPAMYPRWMTCYDGSQMLPPGLPGGEKIIDCLPFLLHPLPTSHTPRSPFTFSYFLAGRRQARFSDFSAELGDLNTEEFPVSVFAELISVPRHYVTRFLMSSAHFEKKISANVRGMITVYKRSGKLRKLRRNAVPQGNIAGERREAERKKGILLKIYFEDIPPPHADKALTKGRAPRSTKHFLPGGISQWIDSRSVKSEWSEDNIEVLRSHDCETRRVWSRAGMKGVGRREIPEKTRRPAASSGKMASLT
ncbi:hypothetical protein PR048_003888 [Dryococelus australis]|uniref:Uncharacterized protein n=1 Tax=Dryococelus australis TaxID=614101 RepID=A0ABQ9IPC0_9NEOP|nr:hypothetical protein PR048_003888 [Dryococelus australis]